MKKIFCLLISISVFLAGCYQKGTVRDTGLYAPYCIAEVNIPLADKLHSSQFDRVAELEKDEYGRCYYSYKTYSVSMSTDIELHIISQTVKDDEVYYYPDYCYLVRLETDPAFSDADIAQLKAWNECNQHLAPDKMYATSYSQKQKDLAYEPTISSAVSAYLPLDDSYGVHCNGLDLLSKNAQLFFVHVFPRTDNRDRETEDYYLVIYQNGVIVSCQQIDSPLSCQEQIWNYRCMWLAEDKQ